MTDYQEWAEHVVNAREQWCNEWIDSNPITPEEFRDMCGEMTHDEVCDLASWVMMGHFGKATELMERLEDEWQMMRAKEALVAHEARIDDGE